MFRESKAVNNLDLTYHHPSICCNLWIFLLFPLCLKWYLSFHCHPYTSSRHLLCYYRGNSGVALHVNHVHHFAACYHFYFFFSYLFSFASIIICVQPFSNADFKNFLWTLLFACVLVKMWLCERNCAMKYIHLVFCFFIQY